MSFEVTYSDIDEKTRKAYAECLITVVEYIENEMHGQLGFEDGLKKDAVFQNFVLEYDEKGYVSIWFQIEQDLDDE